MKELLGLIVFILIAMALIDLLKATMLILAFIFILVCIIGLIYGLFTNIIWKLKERKTSRDNFNKAQQVVAEEKKKIYLQQIERFESGILFGSWKDADTCERANSRKLTKHI